MTRPATYREIKRLFPKANADTIVRCLEDEKTVDQTAAEILDEIRIENVSLKMKIKELQAAIAEVRGEEPSEDTETETETPETPQARSRGVRPMSRYSSSATALRRQWQSLVAHFVAQGLSREMAVSAANRKNPSLRKRLVAESQQIIRRGR